MRCNLLARAIALLGLIVPRRASCCADPGGSRLRVAAAVAGAVAPFRS